MNPTRGGRCAPPPGLLAACRPRAVRFSERAQGEVEHVARGDEDYQVRLGDVLRARDVNGLRAFLEANAARFGDARQVEAVRRKSDEEIEFLLHRMIVARNDLAELHSESRRWLAGRDRDSHGPGGARRN